MRAKLSDVIVARCFDDVDKVIVAAVQEEEEEIWVHEYNCEFFAEFGLFERGFPIR